MRNALLQTQAVALYECNGLLLCHGGISKEFLNALTHYNDGELTDSTNKLVISKINRLYQNAIKDPQSEEYTWLYPYVSTLRDITWCRPLGPETALHWETSLLTYFAVPLTSMVVAHTNVEIPFSQGTCL